jgi:hypothetical protein
MAAPLCRVDDCHEIGRHNAASLSSGASLRAGGRLAYRGAMSAKTTALVLGSGTAGMLAARVLSDSFSEVVIIDRRPIDPATGTFSSGVPQADHLHVLLKRGQLVLERLFPGILATERLELAAPPR